MKVKKLLRFYFSADSLERAFEKLILNRACNPYKDGLKNAEKIIALIEEKKELERLWAYLHRIMESFSEEERERLYKYALRLRENAREKTKEESSAVIKFVRRLRRLEDFEKSFEVLKNYYCLISD